MHPNTNPSRSRSGSYFFFELSLVWNRDTIRLACQTCTKSLHRSIACNAFCDTLGVGPGGVKLPDGDQALGLRTRLSPKHVSVVASILLITDSPADLDWTDCCEEPRGSVRFSFWFMDME